MTSMQIAGRHIGAEHPPYVIAELSANHNGQLAKAVSLVEAAAHAGADAVKLQTYTADTITLPYDTEDFRIRGGLWDGRTLYDLYQQAHTPWEWHPVLFARAVELGITIFSSPFDPTAVDFLDDLGVPAFKIASFEAVDLPLIRYVAGKGKPMIISTGMASIFEIEEAVKAARDGGCSDIALLHCVSSYPAPPSEYNLRTIFDMGSRFAVPIGLSDHTLGNATAIASIAMGASIVEKHFTLDRNGSGPDDSFSMEPVDLHALCRDARTAWEALGDVSYERRESERANVKFRRSLYFVRALKKGDALTPDAIRSVRPGFGLPPNLAPTLVGRVLACDVDAGTAVTIESFLPASSPPRNSRG